MFDAQPGSWTAAYGAADGTPPAISGSRERDRQLGDHPWATDEASNSRVDYGVTPTTLNLNATNGNLVTAHTVTLSGLTPNTRYYYRVTSADGSGNTTTSPPAASGALTFITNTTITDTTETSFARAR